MQWEFRHGEGLDVMGEGEMLGEVHPNLRNNGTEACLGVSTPDTLPLR